MKIVTGGRASGKTMFLIKQSHHTGAVIVAPNPTSCTYIKRLAEEHKLQIPEPISFSRFMDDHYHAGRRNQHYLIDQLDQFLVSFSPHNITIDYVTIDMENIEPLPWQKEYNYEKTNSTWGL